MDNSNLAGAQEQPPQDEQDEEEKAREFAKLVEFHRYMETREALFRSRLSPEDLARVEQEDRDIQADFGAHFHEDFVNGTLYSSNDPDTQAYAAALELGHLNQEDFDRISREKEAGYRGGAANQEAEFNHEEDHSGEAALSQEEPPNHDEAGANYEARFSEEEDLNRNPALDQEEAVDNEPLTSGEEDLNRNPALDQEEALDDEPLTHEEILAQEAAEFKAFKDQVSEEELFEHLRRFRGKIIKGIRRTGQRWMDISYVFRVNYGGPAGDLLRSAFGLGDEFFPCHPSVPRVLFKTIDQLCAIVKSELERRDLWRAGRALWHLDRAIARTWSDGKRLERCCDAVCRQWMREGYGLALKHDVRGTCRDKYILRLDP